MKKVRRGSNPTQGKIKTLAPDPNEFLRELVLRPPKLGLKSEISLAELVDGESYYIGLRQLALADPRDYDAVREFFNHYKSLYGSNPHYILNMKNERIDHILDYFKMVILGDYD